MELGLRVLGRVGVGVGGWRGLFVGIRRGRGLRLFWGFGLEGCCWFWVILGGEGVVGVVLFSLRTKED